MKENKRGRVEDAIALLTSRGETPTPTTVAAACGVSVDTIKRWAPDLYKQITPSASATREAILCAGVQLAERDGYQSVQRQAVADAVGCAGALINSYFGTLKQLQRAIMREAVRTENAAVVAQGLAVRDPHALKASDALKEMARNSLAE